MLHARAPRPQELQLAGINFKAFDLGGHEIARKVWKDYYAKVRAADLEALSLTGSTRSGPGLIRPCTCVDASPF